MHRLSGCATAPAANDPDEQTNRDTLKLNGKIDKYFVVPTVAVYFVLVLEDGIGGGYRHRPQIAFRQHIWWSARREYFTPLDLKGQTYQTIQGIQRRSVDYYSSLRSLYRQMRDDQICNGREQNEDMPDF
jgi:ABC-type transporter lipoprotein component MlaA